MASGWAESIRSCKEVQCDTGMHLQHRHKKDMETHMKKKKTLANLQYDLLFADALRGLGFINEAVQFERGFLSLTDFSDADWLTYDAAEDIMKTLKL